MTQSTTKRTQTTGIALVAAGAIGFSAAIIFAHSIDGLNAAVITGFRALAGFLFFSLLIPAYPHILRVRRYRSDLPRLLGLSVTLGATAVLYIHAVRTTTAANAVLLNNTAPLYVALLSPRLLNEARPRHTWPSLALALIGTALLTALTGLPPTEGEWTGIGAGLLSGLTLGLTLLTSRRLGRQVDGLIQGWWSMGVVALLTLPITLAASRSAVARNLPPLALMGVFAFGLPYLLYFLGLQRINAQAGSLVALLEPVSGVVIGALLYQERPSIWGGIGILLILASIYLISK